MTHETWEPFAKKRIQSVVESAKSSSKTKKADKHYVVFDFDNTISFFDIEDHLMMYLIETFSINMDPDDLEHLITHPTYDLGQINGINVRDLALDVADLYRELMEKPNLDSPLFQSFSAKMTLYYDLVKEDIPFQLGQPWLTYWYEAYTPDTFKELVHEMVSYYSKRPNIYRTWESHMDYPGRVGQVQAQFEQGLALTQEILELFHSFIDHNIEIYIVSASPRLLVQAGAEAFDLPVPQANIFGKELALQESGYLSARVPEASHLTKKEGKTALIKDLIQPFHGGKDPVLVAGDSDGDYHMMTNFEDLQVALILNRGQGGDIKTLRDQAKESYGQEDARYVVQGRDELQRLFQPQVDSLLMKE